MTKKQQTYEAKPNLGKNGAIDFRIQEFLPLSDRPHIEMSLENCCDGGLVTVVSFYQRREELEQQSLKCVARNKCL